MANNHAILNTSAMQAIDIRALNRTGYVNTAAVSTTYTRQQVDNGAIVVMDKMCMFDGIDGDKKYGFAYNAYAPAAQVHAGEFWIVDNPEVGTNEHMYISCDPRDFYVEAGKPANFRRLMKGDIIQISAGAFGSSKPTSTNVYVELDTLANGQYKAVSGSTNAIFKVLGEKKMDAGTEAVDAWYLEFLI